jgi:hypothetical protein
MIITGQGVHPEKEKEKEKRYEANILGTYCNPPCFLD